MTRGLLGLIKNEAELAGVLGHEITHVTAKHTVRAIQKSKGISLGSRPGRRRLAAQNTRHREDGGKGLPQLILDGSSAAKTRTRRTRSACSLASKVGYAPSAWSNVLKKLDARNTGREERERPVRVASRDPRTASRSSNSRSDGKACRDGHRARRATPRRPLRVEADHRDRDGVDGAAGLAGGEQETARRTGARRKSRRRRAACWASSPRRRASRSSRARPSHRPAPGDGLPDRDAKGGANKTPVADRGHRGGDRRVQEGHRRVAPRPQ